MKLPKIRFAEYPYRAILAITSDIDHTEDIHKYQNIHKLMIEEVGIEYSNTFFPYHHDKKFSLLSGSTNDQQIIIDHIKKGYIEALHSFGEMKCFDRKDAENAINFLVQNDCYIKIWIDHADSISNLCKYRFYGKGDLQEEKEYHLDLLLGYGVKYIWTERLTNIIGQGNSITRKHLKQLFDSGFKKNSSKELLKTLVKIFLSKIGSKKYNYFADNNIFQISKMKDSSRVFEFIRFNNHFKGAAIGDSFEDLWYIISGKTLRALKRNSGYCIVYTHLGKNFGIKSELGKRTVSALKNLRNEYENKEIQILTAKNLLDYLLKLKYLNWTYHIEEGQPKIEIKSIDDPVTGSYCPTEKDLAGICFYTSNHTQIYLNSKLLKTQINPGDKSGRTSITIKK